MTKVAITLTVMWLAGLVLWAALSWPDFRSMSPNEWGDFFAGGVGPVALFWVVASFWLQSRELRNSVEALRLQTNELKQSVEQQKAMVAVTQEQLNVDRESKELSNKFMIEQNMPHLILRFSAGVHDGQVRVNRYKLKNVGAKATSVEVYFLTKSDLIEPINFGLVEAGHEPQFQIPTEYLNEKVLVSLISRNTLGLQKSQQYLIDGVKVVPAKLDQID